MINEKSQTYIIEEEEKIAKRMAAEEEEEQLMENAAMESRGDTYTPESEQVAGQLNLPKDPAVRRETSFRTKQSSETGGFKGLNKTQASASNKAGARQTAGTSSQGTASARPRRLAIDSSNA